MEGKGEDASELIENHLVGSPGGLNVIFVRGEKRLVTCLRSSPQTHIEHFRDVQRHSIARNPRQSGGIALQP